MIKQPEKQLKPTSGNVQPGKFESAVEVKKEALLNAVKLLSSKQGTWKVSFQLMMVVRIMG